MSLAAFHPKKIDGLREEYDLLYQKIAKLRKAKVIETDTATIFKLEKQIEQAEEDLQKIEKQLETLNASLQEIPSEQKLLQQKYEMHFHGETKGVVIGDRTKVNMKFNKK